MVIQMKTVKIEYTILVPHQRLDSIEADTMKEQFISCLLYTSDAADEL